MMKGIFLLITMMFINCVSKAGNDIIYKTDRTEIACKVIEIDDVGKSVKYRPLSNLEGPVFTISQSDVFMITMSNGNVWKPQTEIKQPENNYTNTTTVNGGAEPSKHEYKPSSEIKKNDNDECFPIRCKGFEFRMETGVMLYITKTKVTPLWDFNAYWGGKLEGAISLGFVAGMEYTGRDNILVPVGAGIKFYSNKHRASFLMDIDGGYKPLISISNNDALHFGYAKICIGAHIWLSRKGAMTFRTGYCFTGNVTDYNIEWHSMPFTVGFKF